MNEIKSNRTQIFFGAYPTIYCPVSNKIDSRKLAISREFSDMFDTNRQIDMSYRQKHENFYMLLIIYKQMTILWQMHVQHYHLIKVLKEELLANHLTETIDKYDKLVKNQFQLKNAHWNPSLFSEKRIIEQRKKLRSFTSCQGEKIICDVDRMKYCKERKIYGPNKQNFMPFHCLCSLRPPTKLNGLEIRKG
uniref:Uncharacterized protein n=1 Tax=Onchocerca volvulus TaxID=6282 RepID=A0A8R1Y8B3_ONCVO